jgi:hypothetical protein
MIELLQFFKRRLDNRRTAESSSANRDEWSPSQWARVRAPARHRDQTMSLRAQRWLERIPADMRPRELAGRYPRIVNQLAVVWRDHGLADHLLKALLTDTRGGRMGFAPEIVAELEVLYELHDQRMTARTVPVEPWDPAPPRA